MLNKLKTVIILIKNKLYKNNNIIKKINHNQSSKKIILLKIRVYNHNKQLYWTSQNQLMKMNPKIKKMTIIIIKIYLLIINSKINNKLKSSNNQFNNKHQYIVNLK